MYTYLLLPQKRALLGKAAHRDPTLILARRALSLVSRATVAGTFGGTQVEAFLGVVQGLGLSLVRFRVLGFRVGLWRFWSRLGSWGFWL